MKNVFVTNMPFTEEGAKLELTEEMENNCKVVYRLDGKGGATFAELWSPDKDYSDEFIILPLRSTYCNISEIYPAGTTFANVLGSTTDPNPYGMSWIATLEHFYALIKKVSTEDYKITPCCAEPCFYNSKYGKFSDCTCGDATLGGHVVMKVTTSVNAKKGDMVSLLPICHAHNSVSKPVVGTDFYMKLNRPMRAVELFGYLKELPKTPAFQAEFE